MKNTPRILTVLLLALPAPFAKGELPQPTPLLLDSPCDAANARYPVSFALEAATRVGRNRRLAGVRARADSFRHLLNECYRTEIAYLKSTVTNRGEPGTAEKQRYDDAVQALQTALSELRSSGGLNRRIETAYEGWLAAIGDREPKNRNVKRLIDFVRAGLVETVQDSIPCRQAAHLREEQPECAAVTERIAAVTETLDSLLDEITPRVKVLAGRLASLESETGALQGEIGTLAGEASQLQGGIRYLDGQARYLGGLAQLYRGAAVYWWYWTVFWTNAFYAHAAGGNWVAAAACLANARTTRSWMYHCLWWAGYFEGGVRQILSAIRPKVARLETLQGEIEPRIRELEAVMREVELLKARIIFLPKEDGT